MITSKWCIWEFELGDAEKYDTDKIALFPIRQENRHWPGVEYLQIYSTIEFLTSHEIADNRYLST